MPAQKYQHIFQDLKQKIESGVYEPQTALPTEYQLIDLYGCSRNTVRRAVQELSDLGYVQSIHGKGVIVIYQKRPGQEFSLDTVESLKEAADRNHKQYSTKVLHFAQMQIDEKLSKKTGFPVGADVYYVQRVRYFDNQAVIMDNNWFLKSIVKNLTPEICTESVYEYMENTLGESIVTSKRRLTVEKVTQIDEKYLNLGGYDCIACVTSQTFNADGIMFEYTQSRHRPDQFSFSMQAKRVRKSK